ncbi:HNH endonuclease signature motif containing protein [Actinoplanes oblitus]|uniref:HNH endonuclease signature motif containing protein n=1 Tax=Actinoplanes oblitus TaxID=3040509 RepID=A0ABY8WA64_9ACTN|nr:HNH endonuclease signature motif containing protein [Actinoplanes oblitus]WIM94262.1 HNH endonuclease signature motif containing protein [Actinoplanes oblitus]
MGRGRKVIETPIVERIMAKVVKTPGGCHQWEYTTNHGGYGVISWNRKQYYVHRLIAEHAYGWKIDGLTIDHLCRNRTCVRREHLAVVPNEVNSWRRNNKAFQDMMNAHLAELHALELAAEEDSNGGNK